MPSRIGRLTSKFGLKPVYQPMRKLKHWLCPVKDSLVLHTLGICKIHCSRGRVYIGQMGRTVADPLKERDHYSRLNHQSEKSGLAEHCLWYKHQPFLD